MAGGGGGSLIDEGNTIPFIARYRKEMTGSLNDEVLRDLHERLIYLRNLEEKKAQVLGSIEEQGKLTDELRERIEAAQTMVVVEDLYRPYRPKRKTRASVAKEKGLEPLAAFILAQETTAPIEQEAAKYIREDEDEAKAVKTAAEALQGAKDIIAEQISDEADYRIYNPRHDHEGRKARNRRQGRKRRKAFTRCIISMKNLSAKWQGTGCWRSTGVRMRSS